MAIYAKFLSLERIRTPIMSDLDFLFSLSTVVLIWAAIANVVATSVVAHMRGYDAGLGFLAGLFLGVFGLLMFSGLPVDSVGLEQRKKERQERLKQLHGDDSN